ncbi:YHYH domain-containing protein [Rhodobacterales bacterium HKCCE2091]|nr:YHYH domain-containing protein [Rhodobacterales bacterium HKCCE2091]
MLRALLISAAAVLGAVPLTSPVLAHSGGLNAEGCHAGSRPYHCHRGGGGTPRPQPAGIIGPGGGGLGFGGDRDCSDFASWSEAQRFYEQAGYGDPRGLDRDRDGIACESFR